MANKGGLPPVKFELSDRDDHKHQRAMLAYIQVARPVTVDGKTEYISAVYAQEIAGQIEVMVYLKGHTDPVDAKLVSIPPLPKD